VGAADGRAIVDQLLADPPVVHSMDAAGTLGVWSTEPDCYRFIADHCSEGAATLETGAGLSTILFAALRTRHSCVTPLQAEVDRVLEYCRSRSISTDLVRFCVERSDQALPTLDTPDLDLVLIDGGHGFPMAMIDFFYAGGRLGRGGVLILDDVELPAVRLVADFCDLDEQWKQLTRTSKWGAWERRSVGPLLDDHFDQPFLTPGWLPGGGSALVQARRLATHLANGVRRRLRG
jgi:hypothetical protein